MKRILLPQKAKATFYPSLPESAHACLTANDWLSAGNPCLIIVSESITKAESWGEDIAAIAEQISPGKTFAFTYLMKLLKARTRMHLIEFVNGPLSCQYSGNLRMEQRRGLLLPLHPRHSALLVQYLSIILILKSK